MIIEKEGWPSRTFYDLKVGDFFEYGGSIFVYIRLSSGSYVDCWDIEKRKEISFDKGSFVNLITKLVYSVEE